MYVRTIKITFKDKMSKDMFVNYTDTKADAKGIKNGTLMKLIFSNSDVIATLVLIFPDHKTYICLLYTSPSPRDRTRSRMPSSA